MTRSRDPRKAKQVVLTVTVSALLGATSACAQAGSRGADPADEQTTATARHHGHSHHEGMSMEEMANMGGPGRGPSAAAQMICSDEIAGAVARTFRLDRAPKPTHTWTDRLFSCAYELPGGMLHLDVKDSTREEAGLSYFRKLRATLPGMRPIRGLESFGLPSQENSAGDVVFLKDGKTLHVDATHLQAPALPSGFTRSELAYSVAAAVVGCWTE